MLPKCFDDRVSSYRFDAVFHELHAGIVLFSRFCIDFVLLDACIVISGSILYGYWLFIWKECPDEASTNIFLPKQRCVHNKSSFARTFHTEEHCVTATTVWYNRGFSYYMVGFKHLVFENLNWIDPISAPYKYNDKRKRKKYNCITEQTFFYKMR